MTLPDPARVLHLHCARSWLQPPWVWAIMVTGRSICRSKIVCSHCAHAFKAGSTTAYNPMRGVQTRASTATRVFDRFFSHQVKSGEATST